MLNYLMAEQRRVGVVIVLRKNSSHHQRAKITNCIRQLRSPSPHRRQDEFLFKGRGWDLDGVWDLFEASLKRASVDFNMTMQLFLNEVMNPWKRMNRFTSSRRQCETPYFRHHDPIYIASDACLQMKQIKVCQWQVLTTNIVVAKN